jgi:non-canonical purine NTP pyrophosphatase (RdgB/HAM1 family)
MKVTFITGNPKKAEFLAKFLGFPVEHKKLDLDELQSLDLEEITEHKARQAYETVGGPVLVEDVGVVIHSMGKLPGPFIKWFEQELGLSKICKLVGDDRRATAAVSYTFFDGQTCQNFYGKITGRISDEPRGNDGFGWNPMFIPDGADKTLAEMNEAETEQYSLRTTTVYPKLKAFLEGIDNQ